MSEENVSDILRKKVEAAKEKEKEINELEELKKTKANLLDDIEKTKKSLIESTNELILRKLLKPLEDNNFQIYKDLSKTIATNSIIKYEIDLDEKIIIYQNGEVINIIKYDIRFGIDIPKPNLETDNQAKFYLNYNNQLKDYLNSINPNLFTLYYTIDNSREFPYTNINDFIKLIISLK